MAMKLAVSEAAETDPRARRQPASFTWVREEYDERGLAARGTTFAADNA